MYTNTFQCSQRKETNRIIIIERREKIDSGNRYKKITQYTVYQDIIWQSLWETESEPHNEPGKSNVLSQSEFQGMRNRGRREVCQCKSWGPEQRS